MTVRELHNALTERYPTALSAPWDNDGILISPDPDAQIHRVLIALDASAAAIGYAVANGFDLLLTHHPGIFRGARSVTPDSVTDARIVRALSGSLSVVSLHTRLDAGTGGVNETLCRLFGYPVSGAFGDDETPTIARYADIPETSGDGFVRLAAKTLGCPALRVTGDIRKTIRRVGFCGGDGKSLIPAASAVGCDAFLTGDAGYNMAEDYAEAGLLTVEVGHFHSENPVCGVLRDTVYKITSLQAEIYDSCAYQVVHYDETVSE